MKKKIDVKNLKMGMYIADLDRPWIETPFLFQGFTLESEEDLSRLLDICEHVFIDTEKGEDETASTAIAQEHFYSTPIEDEIKISKEIYTKAKTQLINAFHDFRLGKNVDAVSTKIMVTEMVDSVIRNPDALMLLSHLRDKDEHAAAHGLNVCILTLTFGRHLGFSKEQLKEIGIGALLHDIGEVEIPNEIIANRKTLTPEQREILRGHTQLGRDILSKNPDLPKSAAEIAYTHHERRDGSGFPRKLEKDEITFFSKIVGIVNVYDTVTASYDDRGAVVATEALKNMYQWRDKLFDADLIEQFIQCIGIYPIGSVVELSTDEVGIIISVPPKHRLSPKIMLVRDSSKQPYYPPRILNLYEHKDSDNNASYEIKRVLPPDAYGIDLKSYLLREVSFEVQQARIGEV